jgi:hypothetical protein
MKNTITILLLFMTLISYSQETRFQLIDKINTYEGVQIDKFGDLNVDIGSASAGRFRLNLNDVSVKLELRGEEPGCADICPQRALIWFECKDKDCVSDPAFQSPDRYSSTVGTFSFEKGIDLYFTLCKLKYIDFIDFSGNNYGKR